MQPSVKPQVFIRCERCHRRIGWADRGLFAGIVMAFPGSASALHFDRSRNWMVDHCGTRQHPAEEIRRLFAAAADVGEEQGWVRPVVVWV